MEAKIYRDSDRQEWDDFIRSSKNGTFLLQRSFIEYHRNRFDELSYLFYSNNELKAVIAGNVDNNTYYSHQGLTYGGLIMSHSTTMTEVLSIFSLLVDGLRGKDIEQIIYKAIPHIYHSLPAEEDLYALYRFGAVLQQRNISSTILLPNALAYSDTRTRGLKKAEKEGLTVKESNDIAAFWFILNQNLQDRYNTKPVHSLDEITELIAHFPQHIKLYAAYDTTNEMIGACLTFEMDEIIHAQYTAASPVGKEQGAIDAIIHHIIESADSRKKYFDYGISTEQGGKYLNEGLIYQKEGFGARGIVYDIYSLTL